MLFRSVSVEGAAELPADSDAYDDRVAGVVAAIEGIAPAREQARVDGLKAEAQADLDEARAEYEKEEARAKTELADARAELDAAKEELDEGQRKLDAAASTLTASEKKIKDGEKEYTGNWMKYEEASISGTNLGTGAKWNYVYTAGTGTLMAAGFPEGIGTYTVTATYEDSINFEIGRASCRERV